MAKVTWIGDEDPSIQQITHGGYSFVKGIPTDVNGKGEDFADNHFFVVGKDGTPIESKESEPVDADEGTELGAVKAALKAKGIAFGPNSKLDSLRVKLAESE
jgi:hypothetical protein